DDDLIRPVARLRSKRDAAAVRFEAIPAVDVRALLEGPKRAQPQPVDAAREIDRVPRPAIRLQFSAQRAELDRDDVRRADDPHILHEETSRSDEWQVARQIRKCFSTRGLAQTDVAPEPKKRHSY